MVEQTAHIRSVRGSNPFATILILRKAGEKLKKFTSDIQYWKFSAYGFLKNLRFFDPFIILFFRETGISFLEIGTLIAIRAVTVNLLEIPSGLIADTIGRRRSMIFSFASYIVSFFMFFMFHQFDLYIIAMLLFAGGEAFRTGTHKAMILEYLRRQNQLDLKVYYYGHTRSWSQRGSAVSALIAGLIVFTTSSYHSIFLFSIIPYTLDLLLILSYPSYLDFSSENKKELSLKKNILLTLRGFKTVLVNAETRKVLLNSSIYNGFFKSIKDYIQPILKTLVVTIPVAVMLPDRKRLALLTAVIYFILYMLTSFVSKYSGKGVELFKSHEGGLNTAYLAGVFIVLGIGVSLFIHMYVPAVILFILYYMLINFRRPVMTGFVSSKIPHEVMATGLSTESQGKTLVTAVVAPLTGFLTDRFGLGIALVFLAVILAAVYPLVRFNGINREET